MNILSYVLAAFSVLGAIDYILNNKYGIGKDWERGFYLLGTMALSMIGMIVLAPFIAHILSPVLALIPEWVPFEPSIVVGSLLANDMGGATLSLTLAKSESIGYFNGLVVASMMGATTSFTLPLAMGMVEKRQHHSMLLGLMCGIIAVPIGCLIIGLVIGISLLELIVNLIPLVLLAIVLVIGLTKKPDLCVKIFYILGIVVKVIITIGLVLGILEFLIGYKVLPYIAPLEEGAMVVFNAAIVMSGAFPLINLVGRVLRRPLKAVGKKVGMNDSSVLGFVASLATNVTTFGMMKNMDDKGVVLNSAFAVSGAFTFAGHLAFTMSFHSEYVPYVIFGKLIAGVLGVLIAAMLIRGKGKTEK